MQFWGAEVKSGEPLKVTPGDGKLLHLSQACLGEVKKGSEPGYLFVNFNDKKFAIGTLSSEKFPQISLDLVFEKEFELSHTFKNGSVFFTGYRADSSEEQEYIGDSDSEDEDVVPIGAPISGKPEPQVSQAVKPDASSANQKSKNLKVENPKKNDKANPLDTDSSEDEFDESDEDSDDEPKMNGGIESSDEDDDNEDEDEDDDDDDESDDNETPKKAEVTKKRPVESTKKTPVPEKKAKLVTPQKTDGKKGGGHVATPHPSKQAGKAAATNKDTGKQQPKSAGDYSCKPCNRSFKTEDALQSHNKAKHSAK